jgi:hypothetical protein
MRRRKTRRASKGSTSRSPSNARLAPWPSIPLRAIGRSGGDPSAWAHSVTSATRCRRRRTDGHVVDCSTTCLRFEILGLGVPKSKFAVHVLSPFWERAVLRLNLANSPCLVASAALR